MKLFDSLPQRSAYIWLAVLLVAGALFVLFIAKDRAAEQAGSHFRAFTTAMNTGHYQQAQIEIDTAIRLAPGNAYFASGQGVLQARMIQTRFAPNDYLANRFVLTEEDQRQVQASIDGYQAALKINAEDASFYHNLGWLYSWLNQRDRAADCFKRAIGIDGANALYHVSLGLFDERTGDGKAAMGEYVAAVCLSPSLLSSPFFADFAQRSPAGAEAVILASLDYLEAKARQTNDSIFKARLAVVYLYRHRPEAMELLKQVTAGMPGLSRPWLYLGGLYEAQADYDNAKLCYERAAALDQTDFLPQLALARLYDRDHQTAAAKYYDAAINDWLAISSISAARAYRVYMTGTVILDDIVPKGLLAYTTAGFDLQRICLRVAELYRAAGNAELSRYYEALSHRPMF